MSYEYIRTGFGLCSLINLLLGDIKLKIYHFINYNHIIILIILLYILIIDHLWNGLILTSYKPIVLDTPPTLILAGGVPATPQKFPAVTSND